MPSAAQCSAEQFNISVDMFYNVNMLIKEALVSFVSAAVLGIKSQHFAEVEDEKVILWKCR